MSKTTARYEDDGEPGRCRAHSKARGARCKRPKEPGFQVCRMHGAKGGRPIKSGRYSKRLGRVREMYEEAISSGDELLDLRETLALMDVAVQRAATRVADMDTPQFRERAWDVFESARTLSDADQREAKFEELGRLLRDGVEEDQAFEQLSRSAERLAVRQEKAWAIKLSAAQALNARDLVVVMARLVDVIVEEAPENASRIVARIDTEILGSSEVAPRVLDQSGE